MGPPPPLQAYEMNDKIGRRPYREFGYNGASGIKNTDPNSETGQKKDDRWASYKKGRNVRNKDPQEEDWRGTIL